MANVEMTIDSVRVVLVNRQRVVVLKDKQGPRYLPILIGSPEADAISIKLRNVIVATPSTHDFTCSIIDKLGAKLKCVLVDRFVEDTFFGKAFLEKNEDTFEINCRPSDAIAIAVRMRAPIQVAEEILEQEGMSREDVDKFTRSTPARV